MNTLTKRLLWIAVCCLPFISGCKQPNENAVSKNAISDALYRNLLGALNDQSIAWKVAERAVEEGATITLSNTPMAIRMGEVNIN
mgnify:CR=1 FL=1